MCLYQSQRLLVFYYCSCHANFVTQQLFGSCFNVKVNENIPLMISEFAVPLLFFYFLLILFIYSSFSSNCPYIIVPPDSALTPVKCPSPSNKSLVPHSVPCPSSHLSTSNAPHDKLQFTVLQDHWL